MESTKLIKPTLRRTNQQILLFKLYPIYTCKIAFDQCLSTETYSK